MTFETETPEITVSDLRVKTLDGWQAGRVFLHWFLRADGRTGRIAERRHTAISTCTTGV